MSWSGYTLFLLPFIFGRAWDTPMRVSLLMLCVPFWSVRYAAVLGPVANAVLGATYCWAVLLMLAIVLRDGSKETAAAPARGPGQAVATAA